MKYWFEQKSTELLKASQLMTPTRIKEIRGLYKVTQHSFADLLKISYHTYKNWEIGHRKPCTSAVALLLLAESNPKLFFQKVQRANTINSA
jgi:DNA-binding transcriptional regulator YiaG